jgi:hypothetical protein
MEPRDGILAFTTQIKDLERGLDPLQFPDIMSGAAGKFAAAHSAISESPKHFYYLAWLTCLGSYLSGKITLNTILNVQTRLYMLFLGPSGRGRKSTPISIVTAFFQEVLEDFSLMYNANSGEGLGVFLEKNPWTLLIYDEFMAFVSKAIQKGNTLLGTVTTLFEKNAYQTATKDKQLVIENAHLSTLSACTTDTWDACWERDFTAIGLNNRLFLAFGTMESLVAIPPRLDPDTWRRLRDSLRDVIRHALYIKEFDLTPGARALYEDWYKNTLDHRSLHAVRLDAYALRFMLLLGVMDSKTTIDEETVEKVIRLMNWEHLVRQQLDPVDADTQAAKVETKIRRILRTGPKGKKELQQRTNAHRTGLWVWKSALQNLINNQEVAFDPKGNVYRLMEVV